MLSAGGTIYPPLLDVLSTFGEGHAEAIAYFTPAVPLQPTLAVRATGRKVWGQYPFQEAAHVGGVATVRGLVEDRFAGDAALAGNVELRLTLGRALVLLPVDFGIFGLADAGRVFFSGDNSNRWHTGVGGGFWFAFLSRSNTVSIAAARSVEGTRLYLRTGFGF